MFCGLVFSAVAGGPYGSDNGWAIDNTGYALLTTSVGTQMVQGETGWIRIEMRLIPGRTNWDAAMLGYYDTAVNNARNSGLQVLLLIDGGSWPGSQSDWEANNNENNPAFNGDNVYVEGFATNAALPIVQHFRDRVKVYELWNEPNAWTTSYGVGGSFLYPSNYGWLLARSWEAIHKKQGINDVILFFGGVFGHNIGGVTSYGNAGAQYLDDTYSTGTNAAKSGSFRYIKTNYNAYPLDGIGEHIYLSPGGLVASNTFRQYEEWVHQACTKYEGVNTPKKTFITEFGWQTTNSSNANGVSQAVQDTNLVTAFSAINATPYVQMAIWFQWKDNPAGSLWYGVVDSANGMKQAYSNYARFQRFEAMLSTGTTNTDILNYYNYSGSAAPSQVVLGSPFDHGHGAWVYGFLSGYAQDFGGGSRSNLTVIASTNGTFEVNESHGLWTYYNTNNGGTNLGAPLTNEYSFAGGTRQDFARGYMRWNAGQITWFPGNMSPPIGVAATRGNAQVSLHWNPDPPASAYNVKRATTTGGPYTTILNANPGTNYTDTGLSNGTTYFYVVSGTNNVGESFNSAEVSARPVVPPRLNIGVNNVITWTDA
ncbi:MAG TPA: fibronectin type III domain-containing protein, partial [Candidatus Dormibacteraeota bacterium]|nr:fibronectin type III domain-containing protein [Candidatus Dormibacteraeota bacterium]